MEEVEQRAVIRARSLTWAQLQVMPPHTKSKAGEGAGDTNGKESCTLQATILEKALRAKQWRTKFHLPEALPVGP